MKFTIETDDEKEAKLLANIKDIAWNIYDLMQWDENIYKGYDNSVQYLYKGKLYDFWEFAKLSETEEKDEHGMLKEEVVRVYKEEDLLKDIEAKLSKISQIVKEYYE